MTVLSWGRNGDCPGKWWGHGEEPSPWWESVRVAAGKLVRVRTDIVKALPRVGRWWEELEKNDAVGVAYFYELEARILGHYRLGVPFPLLTESDFRSLCEKWPLYGFIKLEKEQPALVHHGHGDFDLNFFCGEAKLRTELKKHERELQLPPRSVSGILRDFKIRRDEYIADAEQRFLRQLQERIVSEKRQRAKIIQHIAKLERAGLPVDELDQQAWRWARETPMTKHTARRLAKVQAEKLRNWFAENRVHRPAIAKNTRRRPLEWEMLERLDRRTPTLKEMESRRAVFRRATALYSRFKRVVKLGQKYF